MRQTRATAALIRARIILCLGFVAAAALSASAQERPTTPPVVVAVEGTAPPSGFIAEPDLIKRAAIFVDRHFGNDDVTNGFYIDFFNMVPGAGWISGGPGYRHWYRQDRVFVDGSAALSWHAFKMAQARFELPRLARSRLMLGSQVRWQDFPQMDYFGEGPHTSEANRSEYGLASTNVVGYATFKPIQRLDVTASLGWLAPSISPRGGTFKRDLPETHQLFPGDIVFAFAEQPTFLHSEASVTADTRDLPNHPTRGGVYRAAATSYSDRDSGVFSFRRYEAEGAQFIPLADSRVVVALRGWLAVSDTGEGQFVPFYLQPSLGGHNTLRSYPQYRFHDRNLLVVNTEVRVAMWAHVDAAVFLDAGNVAPRVADLDLSKRSYGAGVRFHGYQRTFARFDVAHGAEGWQFLFRLTEPLSLSRLSRRTAAVPFVP
jgi:Omp85 superfamily domain